MTGRVHDKAITELAKNPHLIGIECQVAEVFIELPIHANQTYQSDKDYDSKDHKGRLLAEADLLYHLENGLWILGEYKCNDGPKQRLKALEQLVIASKGLFEGPRNITITHMAYIYGNPYNVEELTSKDGHFSWSTYMTNRKRV